MKFSATLHMKCDSCKKNVDVEREIGDSLSLDSDDTLSFGICLGIATENGFHVMYERSYSADNTILLCDSCYQRLREAIGQQSDETE